MTVSASFELASGELLRRDLPVCTNREFREIIEPKALLFGLYLVYNWRNMVEINTENHSDFKKQIELLVSSINNDRLIETDEREHLQSRLRMLLTEVDKALLNSECLNVEIG